MGWVWGAGECLGRYQMAMAETGCVAEIAAVLVIPERTAAALAHHAVNLQEHPKTRAALRSGVLSWRQAITILNELGTLGETPDVSVEDAAVFEGRWLVLAEGTTALRFANKARRAREFLFPESLDTRVKEAFRGRKITNDAGKDGMNSVQLYILTIAPNAIMVHCTSAARAIKADALERQREAVASGSGEDCTEYRTLDRLRADVASMLLMGQELPKNARFTTPIQSENQSQSGSQSKSQSGNLNSAQGPAQGSRGGNRSCDRNEASGDRLDGAGVGEGFGGATNNRRAFGFNASPGPGGQDDSRSGGKISSSAARMSSSSRSLVSGLNYKD